MAQAQDLSFIVSGADIHGLATTVLHLTASRYLSVAGYAILLYDHMLTFADEVELVWNKPINTVSALFLINRYIPPLVIAVDLYDKTGLSTFLSNNFCQVWFWVEGIAQLISHMLTHILVALRLSALYERNRLVDAVLSITGVAYLTGTISIGILSALPIRNTLRYSPELHICTGKIGPSFFLIWLPALLYECFLFGMTVFKAYQHHKRNLDLPVTHILYRDGFLYFVVIALCATFNLITWSALPQTLGALSKYFTFSLINVMSAKLVLNLRGLQRDDHEVFLPERRTGDRVIFSGGGTPQLELQRFKLVPRQSFNPHVNPRSPLSPSTQRSERPYYFDFDAPADDRFTRWTNRTKQKSQSQESIPTSRRSDSSRKWPSFEEQRQNHKRGESGSRRLEVRVDIAREVISDPSGR